MAAVGSLKQPADGADPRLDDRGYDALLVVSFGGPEGPDDVMPFLENVTRGRNGPPTTRLTSSAPSGPKVGAPSTSRSTQPIPSTSAAR